MVKLGTLSDGSTTRPAGTEFVILDTGNVGVGTSAPNSNAILDLSATNKAILLPRLASIANITSPVDGMVFYHSVQKCFKGYANGTWLDITTCSPNPAAITFKKVNKYNGVSVIQDRTIHEDAMIFAPNLHAMGLMSTRDFENYTKLFETISSLIQPP